MDSKLNVEQFCSHPESEQELRTETDCESQTNSNNCQLVSQEGLHPDSGGITGDLALGITSRSPRPETVMLQGITADYCTQNEREESKFHLENLKGCPNSKGHDCTSMTKVEIDQGEARIGRDGFCIVKMELEVDSVADTTTEEKPSRISIDACDNTDEDVIRNTARCDNESGVNEVKYSKTNIEIKVEKQQMEDMCMETKTLISDSSSSDDDSTDESEIESSSSDDEDHRIEYEVEEKSMKVPPPPPATGKEIKIQNLPEVQYINMVLDEKVKLCPLGLVSSIIGQLVIIKSVANTPALDMETVLFKEDRQALGRVFEVFGPVHSPLYSIRFNSTADISHLDIRLQLNVFYAPRSLDLTSYVFTSQLLKLKGSDASWKGDEEPPEQLLDYSDDEQEKLAKTKRKQNKDPHKRKTPSQRTGQKIRIDEEKSHSTGNAVPKFRPDGAANNKNDRSRVDLGWNRHRDQAACNSTGGTWPQQHNYQQSQPQHMPSYQQYPPQYQQMPLYHQHPPFPINMQPHYRQTQPPNMPFPPPPGPFPVCPPTVPTYIDTSKPPPPMWNTHTSYSSTMSYSGQPTFGNNTNNQDMLSFLNSPPPPPPT